jgi:hypothetical protein
MRGWKKNRLFVILAGALTARALYFGAYFACVSIHFRRSLEYKVANIESAFARDAAGPLAQNFAQWFFEPARLCDACYLRSSRWEDRKQSVAE